MKFLFSLFLIIFVANHFSAQATLRTDSILLVIEKISDDKKLDKWIDWFSDISKEELPLAYQALDQAYVDALRIIGQDSAMFWLYNRQSSFVSEFQKYGKGDVSVQILDQMNHFGFPLFFRLIII